MDKTDAGKLRDFFLAAAREEEKQQDEYKADIAARQAVAARRAWANVVSDDWEPDSVEDRRVFIGGWVFRHLPGYHGYGTFGQFQLLGECPRCGQVCWSAPCPTAAAIGEQLELFKPERDHVCPSFPGRIKEGDVVDVQFTSDCQSGGAGWTVLNRPGDTGEMWEFRQPDGSVVAVNPYASSFEGVYLSKKDKETTCQSTTSTRA